MAGNDSKVLIVDDEETVCDILSDILEDEGYSCKTVPSAHDALAKLSEDTFDVALVDIRMPGVSGLELLSVMRESYPATQVIMSTAVNDVDTAVEAMKKGASDYILKPFSVDGLCERVGSVLKRRETQLRPHTPIEAVAHGVEMQVEEFDFHSRIVTEKTVEAARKLGLSEETIDDWVASRREISAVRQRRIGLVVPPKASPQE